MNLRLGKLALAARGLGLLLLATCVGDIPTSSSPPLAPPISAVTTSTSSALLIGAGNVARCDVTSDEATGLLLDAYPNATVFTAGDNINGDGSLTDFNNCYGPSWGRNKARTRPSVGEDEYRTAGAPGFFQYFGAAGGDSAKYYYSYDVAGWHIMALNDQISMAAGSPQEQWLRAQLAANTKGCTLAYWNHPRFTSTGTNNLSYVKPLWDALYAYNADVVVNAHYGVYERFAPQTPAGTADALGIREFIVGTGGLNSQTPGTAIANSEVRKGTIYGILKLTLDTASYAWEFVPIAGSTFTDAGTNACHTRIAVASIDVTPPAASVLVNATVQLTATPKDAAGNPLAGRVVTWQTSNATIATVDATGLVTGHALGGPVTITATSEGKTGTSAITVTTVAVASVDVAPPSASLQANATVQLTATPKDANGNPLTGRTITWATSDATIATVNATGLVTGRAVGGPVTVTATSEGQTGTSAITVTAVSAAQSTVTAAPTSLTAGSGSATITVTVKDASGTPISGATVVLAATGTGNTLTQPSGPTDAAGVATGTLSSTGADVKTVSATASGTAITQTATVTVTPGPVSAAQSTVSAAPASIVVGTGTSTITVTAKDANGNPISGATVVLAATGTGNTLTQPSGMTDAAGVATGTLSSTVVEPKTVSATINGTAITQTAAVTVTTAAVSAAQSTVTAAPASIVAASGSATITVTVKDASGTPISGATVVLAATGTGNTLTQPSGPTDAAGIATGTLSSTGAEVKTVSATANGTAITQTATVTVTPGPVSAAQSTVSAAPASIVAGSGTSTITVTAKDANGNPISGATVVLAATGTGNTLTQPSGTTNGAGVATGTLSSTVAEPKTVSATINGTAITQTAAVTVTTAAVSAALSTVTAAPASIVAGSGTATITVTAKDAGGNPISGVTVVLAATGSGNTLTQPSGTTNAAGVATGTLSSIGAGPKTVSATANGTAITQTATVTVAPGPVSAAQSTVTAAPTSIAAGSGTSTITVTAKDANGNPISGATVVLAATGSGNALTQPSGTTNAGGVATGTFSSTVAESKTVSATINGTAITQTAAVSVTIATSVILVGAGDIASCSSSGDEATATLLDGIAGTVFTLGDNAYESGSASDFTNCYNPSWGRHKARTRPTAGNHDYSTSGAAGYFGYFGAAAGDPTKGYYSYDLGDWHVVVLNNYVPMTAGSTQEQWLRADLAASTKQCTVAMWHEPLFSSGPIHQGDPLTQPLWRALYDGGAEIALWGHDHNYERFAPLRPDTTVDTLFGVRAFVVGTGGASLDGVGNPPARGSQVRGTGWGVMKLTLQSGAYTWQFVPAPGVSFTDQGSGRCHGAPAASPPVANPGGPYAADGTVTFNGTASYDPQGDTPLTYAWNFGDGTTGSGATPTHTYTATGGYTVTLVVTDSKGNPSAPATTTATISNQPPSVNAGPDQVITPGGTVSLSATFTDNSNDTPWTYTISWGDASPTVSGTVTSTPGQINSSHTYSSVGQFTLQVSVTDRRGATGSDNAIVTVSDPSASQVLVGAGDIAYCGRTDDEATAALLDNIPGTVFTIGDNVLGNSTTTPDFPNCYGPSWGRHKARTHPAPGHMEYWVTGASSYFAYFGAAAGEAGKGYYSYDLGAWHIIVLNSALATSAGSTQELWLKADLAASTKQCTMAVWHLPRFSSVTGTVRDAVKPLWDDLYAAHAELALNAHDEVYERYAPQTPAGVADPTGGIRQFTVGTGGIGSNPFGTIQPNSEVRSSATPGVLKLTLATTGYSWQFVPIAGKTFTDSGSGSCH